MPPDPQQLVIAASMPGGAGTLEERMATVERASRNSLTTPRLEAWHSAGAAGEPAFEGSWSNQGGVYLPVQFYKGPDDVVRCRGTAKWVSGGAPGSVIFHLPAGYRPTQMGVFPAYMTYTGITTVGEPVGLPTTYPPPVQAVVVDNAGAVSASFDGNYNSWGMTAWLVSLDAVQFRTT